jgi:hypothetical protein
VGAEELFCGWQPTSIGNTARKQITRIIAQRLRASRERAILVVIVASLRGWRVSERILRFARNGKREDRHADVGGAKENKSAEIAAGFVFDYADERGAKEAAEIANGVDQHRRAPTR